LYWGAIRGHAENVTAIINVIKDPKKRYELIIEKNGFDQTILHTAAELGNDKMVSAILLQLSIPTEEHSEVMEKVLQGDLTVLQRGFVNEDDDIELPQAFPLPPEGIVGQMNGALFSPPQQPVEKLESALKRARISPEGEDIQLDGNPTAPGPNAQTLQ